MADALHARVGAWFVSETQEAPMSNKSLALLVIALCLLLPSPAAAQDPVYPYSIHFPLIGKAQPSPCNASARALVLQPGDLPAGYLLDGAGPVTLNPEVQALGAADGYRASYSNDEMLFAGTLLVDSAGLVFYTPEGARAYLAWVAARAAGDPGMERVALPVALGEESLAVKSVSYEFIPAVAYIVLVRYRNLVAVTSTGGILNVAPFGDALALAAKSPARMEIECEQD
jgi:hypothetical protein